MSKSICLNCKNHKDNYCYDLKMDLGKEITVKCLGYEYKKTNFDAITESTEKLAKFIKELDSEMTLRDNICKFCSQYTEFEEPACYIDCTLGFKLWLESEIGTNE